MLIDAAGYRAGMPASQDRRARVAITAVFFATGFVVAAWSTRIPAIQQRLGLSPGTFAVAVLGLEGGALVGLPVGGALVVAAPTAVASLLGWATLGAGLAAIAPAILGAVPAAAWGPLPVAIAAVTTLGYLGSFTGPPLVGALAELTGLTRALGLLMVAALVPILLARRALDPRAAGERQPSLR